MSFESYRPIPRDRSFRVIDMPPDLRDETVADAGGIATIELATVPPDQQLWLVERVVVGSTSVNPTQFALYRNAVDLANRVEFTDGGNGNVADEAQAIRFQPADLIIAQWTGATPAARCTISLQYSRAILEG
jgi:hypothetical protein